MYKLVTCYMLLHMQSWPHYQENPEGGGARSSEILVCIYHTAQGDIPGDTNLTLIALRTTNLI
jgi:hypothetical protein